MKDLSRTQPGPCRDGPTALLDVITYRCPKSTWTTTVTSRWPAFDRGSDPSRRRKRPLAVHRRDVVVDVLLGDRHRTTETHPGEPGGFLLRLGLACASLFDSARIRLVLSVPPAFPGATGILATKGVDS